MNLNQYITPEMKLWAFRAYLTLRQFAISSWNFSRAVASATYAALQPNDYVFYEGYEMPVQAWKVKSENPGTPRAYWYYNPSNRCFFKTSPTGETHRFPFLSASLCFNSMNLFSLDEFLGEQHYVGEQPPPLVVIGAWCLVNGVVLDKALDFKIHVINEMGEEKYYGPWATDWKEPVTPKNVYSMPKPSRRIVSLRPPPPIGTEGVFGDVPIGTQISEHFVPEREKFIMKEDCDAADSQSESIYAAYPASFGEVVVKTTRLRNSTAVAEETAPPTESSVTADLSGSEVKVD